MRKTMPDFQTKAAEKEEGEETAEFFPHKFSQNTFSPLPGITVCYTKIPDIINFIFSSPLDPHYQKMPCQKLKQHDFKIPFLSADELITVNRFKAQKKQIEWICGRFALKALVNRIFTPHVSPGKIKISYREKGAPFLDDHPDIPISLSHSNDYTAAAISLTHGTSMGIDIEKIKKTDDFFMKTAFTKKEISHMVPAALEIFRHWTMKEAFLKYIKMGFHESLHSVEIIDSKIFHNGKKQALNSCSRTIEEQYILSIVADPQ